MRHEIIFIYFFVLYFEENGKLHMPAKENEVGWIDKEIHFIATTHDRTMKWNMKNVFSCFGFVDKTMRGVRYLGRK